MVRRSAGPPTRSSRSAATTRCAAIWNPKRWAITGVAIQNELRTPNLAKYLGSQANELRGHVFFDSGYAAINDPLVGQTQGVTLGSVGVGATLKLFNYFNSAVDVGVPLKSSTDTNSGSVFARFRIWGEF